MSFEDDGGYLRAGNDAAAERYGDGYLDEVLLGSAPLGPPLRERLYRLRVQRETQWDIGVKGYGPWTEAQQDRFNSRVRAALVEIRHVLGPEFKVEYVE